MASARWRAALLAAAVGVLDGEGRGLAGREADGGIDRQRVIARHDVVLDRADGRTPLQVGNGEFAFACDATGLQTLDAESHPGRWAGRPAWFEAYGCMPGVEIDPAVMARNLDVFLAAFPRWRPRLHGCDFPMLAMTAARPGRPRQAVDFLLDPGERNAYLANGFNVSGSTPFLPAHGGLLWAVALMAGGWEGGPHRPAPGFPDDGSWTVRAEGLRMAP